MAFLDARSCRVLGEMHASRCQRGHTFTIRIIMNMGNRAGNQFSSQFTVCVCTACSIIPPFPLDLCLVGTFLDEHESSLSLRSIPSFRDRTNSDWLLLRVKVAGRKIKNCGC
ncbi:hypothetical protein X777_15867 [Ooceraea biroi]|uniref:Uncharacterized protein n=1 Tax=Ooceraea biroi TaxID=2015173 RepID=A0A026WVV2_OOCBI|nr:hypothetical protein X777_15867 [Ooceraea biroi]